MFLVVFCCGRGGVVLGAGIGEELTGSRSVEVSASSDVLDTSLHMNSGDVLRKSPSPSRNKIETQNLLNVNDENSEFLGSYH